MIKVDISSYAEIVEALNHATCTYSVWSGRKVNFKDNRTMDLLELSIQVTGKFLKQGCPLSDRQYLKTLNERLFHWFQETGKAVSVQNVFSKAVDEMSYPTESVSTFWGPEKEPLQVENLITDHEWTTFFPGVDKPDPFRVIDRYNLFTDEQIRKAREEAFELT